MMFRLEKPSIKHKKQATEMRAPYLEADGGIEGCAALDCFLKENVYEDWLANLSALLNDPCPNFASLEVFFFVQNERIIGMVSIFHTLPPAPYDLVGHLGYSIHLQERRN